MNRLSNEQRRLRSACYVNRDLVLKMANENFSLNEIARQIKTNSRHVRAFLDREGVQREYPNNYGRERSPAWKGGRSISRGYVRILIPEHPNAQNGYVLEHRLVMEKMIGRYLLPNEVVHHINGVKDDNRPENLQLFSENKEHLRHELSGRVPKWTDDGILRMRKGIARSAMMRRPETHVRSEHDVRQWK